MKTPRHGPGRPPKYGRPSHAITVTLPEDVLTRLKGLDADLGRAIVALVEQRDRRKLASPQIAPAHIASYGNHAVIVVNPAKALKRLPGVQLVPAGNGQSLISLEEPNSISRLELNIGDALEAPDISDAERQTLEAIAGILRRARRSRGMTLKERSIIVLESKRPQKRHS